jgi:hypothetical protein
VGDFIRFAISILDKYKVKIEVPKSINIKKPQQMLGFCDLDWIQTSNLLSRNQVRYSVAPRGLFAMRLFVLLAGANIGINV